MGFQKKEEDDRLFKEVRAENFPSPGRNLDIQVC